MSPGTPQQQDQPTSPTLIVSVRDGDDAAWRRLVKIYGPLVFRWCQRCGLQESDAFDASQEVLMGVNRSLEKFEHQACGGSFRAWLWTITRNKVANFRDQSSNEPKAGGGTQALQAIESLPDKSPETSEDIAELHLRALEGLKLTFTTQTWTAFWRVAVEGDAAADVAEDLGITVWAVYKARSRILLKLKEELGVDGCFE